MPESQIQVRLNPDIMPSGSDLAIINAARRSFNTRSEWESDGSLKPKDKRLPEFLARGMTKDDFEEFVCEIMASEYLMGEDAIRERLWKWRNTPSHDTPFDHPHVSFEVKAPIFVARQLVKHEYLVMSEFSRRYITDDIEFYEPDYWRKAAPNKKQGSLEEPLDIDVVNCFGEEYKGYFGEKTLAERVMECQQDYLEVFNALLKAGVAPEQARMVLPQSTMTEWTWSGSLGAFCKMCRLRLHPEAQYEARLVAKQVYEYLKEYYPVGAKALVEGPDV